MLTNQLTKQLDGMLAIAIVNFLLGFGVWGLIIFTG